MPTRILILLVLMFIMYIVVSSRLLYLSCKENGYFNLVIGTLSFGLILVLIVSLIIEDIIKITITFNP
jgi:hypothetical protein